MKPVSGLSLYDPAALKQWQTVALPDNPDDQLKAAAVEATERACQLRDQLSLAGESGANAVRAQAQQLKADFLAVARTPDRLETKGLKDQRLAYQAALAGLMTGALEGALSVAGFEVCSPIPIPPDQWGSREVSSEIFAQPAEQVAKEQNRTPLPPSNAKTVELMDRQLTGGFFRSTRMSARTEAEGMQSSFESAHTRVVQGLTANVESVVGQATDAPQLAQWTVLKYCISDTTMAGSVTDSVRPFAETSAQPGLRVLVQHGGFGDAARFEVGDGVRILEQLPGTDMGKAQSLQEFLEYGVTQFPSERYLVCVLGHGTGIGSMMPDEAHGSSMTVEEFGQALQGASERLGRKFDVAISDNCLGGSADMAKQVAPAAHYWLSSEDIIDGDRTILNGKKLIGLSEQVAQGETSVEQVVEKLGTFGHREQRGVFHLDHYPAFESAFARFAAAVDKSSLSNEEIGRAGELAVPAFLGMAISPDAPSLEIKSYYDALKDSGSLLTRFAQLDDPEIQRTARQALDALKKMTVSNHVHPSMAEALPDLAGLSVLMPMPPESPEARGPAYELSSFAQETGWLETIQRRFPS